MTVTEVRPDDDKLRLGRRERVLAEMEASGVDILVVGREANARYLSGVQRLWTAGSRPFGPGCVLVRATGSVHLLSTWDEGVPDDIPHENLYGITFNSANLLKALQGIEGAATAQSVATDALTPSSVQLLAAAFPSAEVVDGEHLLGTARRLKTQEEIEAIRASVGIAERSLDLAVATLAPGITERQLTGAFMGAMASLGVTTPSTQDVAWITSRERPWRGARRDEPAKPGDLVAFDAGVIHDGYVGEVGRTHVVGDELPAHRSLFGRRDELWERLLGACRPGAPLSGLLEAYEAAGVPPPPMPVARGLGLGYDLPLVTFGLPHTAAEQQVEAGMVLAVTAYVWEQDVGAAYLQEPIVISADGPEVLTTSPSRERRSPMT